jgi:hypothetical protein
MIVVRVKVSRGFEPLPQWGSTVRTLVNCPMGDLHGQITFYFLITSPGSSTVTPLSVLIEAAGTGSLVFVL